MDSRIRLNGVTPNRGRLEMVYMGVWTPVCMPTSSREASFMAAGACRKMSYIDVLDVALESERSTCVYMNCTSNLSGECTAFSKSGFVSCRSTIDRREEGLETPGVT